MVLSVVASFAEVLSLGTLIPFLGLLSDPRKVFAHPYARPLVEWLDASGPLDLLVPVTGFFVLAIIISACIRLGLLWASTHLSFAIGADLSFAVYRRTLYQPYPIHVNRNSSEIISAVTNKTHSVIIGVVYPCANIISSSIMTVIVIAALVAFEPTVAVVAFVGFGLIYASIALTARAKLTSNGQQIAQNTSVRIKTLQEGLGAIRDVIIDGTQESYCATYREADQKLRLAQGENAFFGASPRYLVEAVGMIFVAALALMLALRPGGMGVAIPIVGALALGAQRLLPLTQQIYTGWASIRGNQKSLQDILELLDQPVFESRTKGDAKQFSFSHSIAFEEVSFQYRPDLPVLLQQLTFSIPKGARVGVVGSTGSGKSTLLDLLMGLLSPTQGRIVIDATPLTDENRSNWRAHIAHVPQSIFLSDGTVEENIALGVPRSRIEPARVRAAAERAQIADVIEAWKEGYGTSVGERGIKLSGGQRQRIGIARALYKQADVIVFDEATSALDNDTETAVMKSIESLSWNLTIFIIAHRLSTLRFCDLILEVSTHGVRLITSEQWSTKTRMETQTAHEGGSATV